MASYTDILKEKVVHTPIMPSKEEREKLASKATRKDTIEPELVAAVASMGKHAIFYPKNGCGWKTAARRVCTKLFGLSGLYKH